MSKTQKILAAIVYIFVTLLCALPISIPFWNHSSDAGWGPMLLIFTGPIWLIMNIFMVILVNRATKPATEVEVQKHKVDSRVALAFVSFPVVGILWAIASDTGCHYAGFSDNQQVLFGQDCLVSSGIIFVILYFALIIALYVWGQRKLSQGNI